MAQIINDWIAKRIIFLTSIVFGLVGIWGGYQVLGQRVNTLEINMQEACEEIKCDKKDVWERLEMDRIERLTNEKSVRETNFSLQLIQVEQSRMANEMKKQTASIEKILVEIHND